MHYNYLIIGGGIAGVTAAEAIRELDGHGTIAIISQEPHLLYSRVLLPSYVKGHIRRDQVFLRTLDDFEKKDIDLFLVKEAALLNTEKREIKTKDGDIYSFDKLLIASGGSPRILNILGESLPGVFRLQTLDDADGLKEFLKEAEKIIIVGGGFIALEFLEIARAYNISATLIVRNGHFFNGILDSVGGDLMNANFERFGIKALFNDEAVEFSGRERPIKLRTRNGLMLEGDIIGIGSGLKMNTDFALGTDIGVSPGGGIRTNEFLETAVPGIFAAGDVAEYFDVIFGRYHKHGNWTNAFLQGRIAGKNMVGGEMEPFKNIPFYSITNLGLHITFLGEADDAEDVETVTRADVKTRRYERFFLREGKLVGAAIINMFHDKPALAELIEKKIVITDALKNLADISFDVKRLLA